MAFISITAPDLLMIMVVSWSYIPESFNFSCMATIEVGFVLNQIVRGGIIKPQNVDRNV